MEVRKIGVSNIHKIIVEIQGGLGNQLFGYMAGAFLANKKSADLIIDTSWLPHGSGNHMGSIMDLGFTEPLITINYEITRIEKLRRRMVDRLIKSNKTIKMAHHRISSRYLSVEVGFDEGLTGHLAQNHISGYFQTYRYFEYLKKLDSHLIQISWNDSQWVDSLSKRIEEENPIIIHVRLGDYLKEKDRIGLLSIEYYRKALNLLFKEHESQPIWVFSDEIEKAEKFLSDIDFSFEYIRPPKESSPIDSLRVMSLSRKMIICNSTFSYWGAMLGATGKTVIAPGKWFKNMDDPSDLLPPHWIKVPSIWRSDV